MLETETVHPLTRLPVVRYYLEGNDWCAPNLPALKAMLLDVGFARVEVVHTYSLPRRVARALDWRGRGRRPLLPWLTRGRAVVHAWK